MRKLGILLALLVMAGCSKQSDTLATAQVYTAADLRQEVGFSYVGDAAYAQVSSAALPQLYDEFRAEIFRKGVTKWDEKFDCNHFAAYYVALAQTKFYLDNFHSRTSARSLAVGVYWFESQRLGPHAVVAALTERGLLFIEPQTGQEITLTAVEKQSAWLRAF